MFQISKKFNIDIAHQLVLPYESKCCNIHGHTVEIELVIVSEQLNENGMIIDFNHLKPFINKIKKKFDHKLVLSKYNKICQSIKGDSVVLDIQNTTSELLAKYICEMFYEYLLDMIAEEKMKEFEEVKVIYKETNDNTVSYTMYFEEDYSFPTTMKKLKILKLLKLLGE